MDSNVKYQTVNGFETFATNIAFPWAGTELFQQLRLEMDQGKMRLETCDTCIAKLADNDRSWFTATRKIITVGGVVD